MTGADLIQILMRDENVDKEVEIVTKNGRQLFRIDEAQGFGSTVQLLFDDLDYFECDLRHADDNECNCDCDMCFEGCLG